MRDRLLGARAGARQALCIVLALAALALQTGRVSSQATLVAAWSFNEGTGASSDDRSANDHTATLSGAAWTTGRYGSGLAFDGVDDIVTVADANPLDLCHAVSRVSAGHWSLVVRRPSRLCWRLESLCVRKCESA